MAHRTKRPDKRRSHHIHRMAGEADTATPLMIALNRAALLLPHERAEILAPVHAAFEAFRLGAGTVDHWAHLVDSINIAKVLATRQIASDHAPTFEAASQALRDVHDRHASSGCWTLRGTEIAALDLAIFVHKVQLDHCSRGELGESVQRVINVVRAALAGNAAPGTHICMPGQLGTTAAGAAAGAAA